MNNKQILHSIFESELQKETMHLLSLEQSILKKVKNPEKRSVFMKWKLPQVVAAIILFLVISSMTVVAMEPSIREKILQLQLGLQRATEEALRTGEIETDIHGEKIFVGKTAEEMKKLHLETSREITELKARPKEEREKTIAVLQQWIDANLYTAPNIPNQDTLAYANRVTSDNDPTFELEMYASKDYLFQVDPIDNKVYNASIIGSRAIDDPNQTYLDQTPRYNQQELEAMAVEFIKKQLPTIDLSTLKLERGNKSTNYFFTWKGDQTMIRPTKKPEGSVICGDVAKPEFYDEQGVPCMMQKTLLAPPSIMVSFTQGGQLLTYANNGF